MRASKSAKVAVKQVNLYTSSKAIVNPVYTPNPTFFQKMSRKALTMINYALVRNIFVGFNEKEFLEKSVDKFNNLQKLVISENKTRLIGVTAQPLLDFLFSCQQIVDVMVA